jgi:hypothetical protein
MPPVAVERLGRHSLRDGAQRTLHLARACLPHLRRSASPAIVQVTSRLDARLDLGPTEQRTLCADEGIVDDVDPSDGTGVGGVRHPDQCGQRGHDPHAAGTRDAARAVTPRASVPHSAGPPRRSRGDGRSDDLASPAASYIVGGGSGIGEATSHVFGANGAAVLVADVVAAQADRVAADVIAAGGHAVAAAMDISNQDNVERAAAAAQAAFGRLDILANCAAIVLAERLEHSAL